MSDKKHKREKEMGDKLTTCTYNNKSQPTVLGVSHTHIFILFLSVSTFIFDRATKLKSARDFFFFFFFF